MTDTQRSSSKVEEGDEEKGKTEVPPKKAWFSLVTDEFQRSHLLSNTSVSGVIVFLEEVTEREFWCPCKPEWNALYSAAYFVIPAILVFLLMLSIRGPMESCRERLRSVFLSMIPSVVWLILVFYEGQCYACGKTTWRGNFANVGEEGPKKWCKPHKNSTVEKLLDTTEEWFSESQSIGKSFLAVLAFIVGVQLIYSNLKKKKNQDPRINKEKDPRTNKDKGDPAGIELEQFVKVAEAASK